MGDTLRRMFWLGLAGWLALALGFAPAPAQEPPTLQQRLDELSERMDKQVNAFWDENWKDDLTEEQRREVVAKRPGLEFVPQFEALAVEGKGTDVAASARMRVFSIQCDFQQKAEAAKTLDRLLTESIGSKALEHLPGALNGFSQLSSPETIQKALETLLEKSPHREVKASALFTLGQRGCDSRASDAQKAQGRKCFERLIAEFPDVKGWRRTYKEAAEAFLFELDRLQVGMVAPDFESTDENGTKFKLSDYRGKVVVLDFWGAW